MEPILILAVIFGFVIYMSKMSNRAKEQKDKLRVLEEALRSGQIDEATKRDLLRNFGGAPSGFNLASLYRNPLFVLGWIGFFLGIALVAIDHRDSFEAGMITTFVSFAVLTLPFAIKELESRRPA